MFALSFARVIGTTIAETKRPTQQTTEIITTPAPTDTPDQKTTNTQAPKTTITTTPAPTSAAEPASKATTALDVSPALTMGSETEVSSAAVTTTVTNLRVATVEMRTNIRNKVRSIFRDREVAATQLKETYGLDKITEISVVSDLSDSDDGKRVIQSVTLKGYSITTFTSTARTNFCHFVTNRAGFSAGMCEILTVTSDASSAAGDGRRVLQDSASVTVKYAVWYDEQDAYSPPANNNVGGDAPDSGGGANVTVVAIVVVVILVVVAALAVGLVLYFMRSRTKNPIVPQSFTNLYAPTASTGDDFSFDDNSNRLADGTLSVNEQEDKFSVATF